MESEDRVEGGHQASGTSTLCQERFGALLSCVPLARRTSVTGLQTVASCVTAG